MSAAQDVVVDRNAFDLRPAPDVATGDAVLCLHGLTGTPYEVLPVAESLVARGVRARGPWMAGHEGGVATLATTPHEEWVQLALDELAALRAEHERVFLVGVSMGGLVGLRLAQVASLDAMVVIGVPLALAPPIPQLLPLIRLFASGRPKRGNSDIREPGAKARHPGLEAMPFAAVAELIELQRRVVPELERLYYDTALSTNWLAFRSLFELVNPDHVLFGSDYPFAPEQTMPGSIKQLQEMGLEPEVLRGIERDHALKLFPHLAD